MAYDKDDIEVQALKAIQEHDITFFDDICLYVEPSRATLYNLKLDELDTIKDALRKNKLRIKAKMRKNWQQHDSPVLQVAAYKLLADTEELAVLTMNKVQAEHTGKDGAPIETENKHIVEFRKMNNGSTPSSL